MVTETQDSKTSALFKRVRFHKSARTHQSSYFPRPAIISLAW